MNEKVDKFFNLLHPEYDTLSPEEQSRALNDRKVIEDNINMIEIMYESGCNAGKSPEESIKGVVNLQKASKYFEILHPESELETLSDEAYNRVLNDKTFIKDNIDEIDRMYVPYMSKAEKEGRSKQEVIAAAVKEKKVDKYFELLHPEYKTLSPEEQFRVISDKTFMQDNLDMIEIMYESGCSAGKSPEEAIKGAVNLRKKFSAQEIGKTTINVPTSTKKEVTEKENEPENTIKKEGVEFDDN